VELTPSSDHIKYGSVIQILAGDRTLYQLPLAVSVTVNEADVDINQKITEKSEVTLGSGCCASARNSFRIIHPQNYEESERCLKYGDDFLLQCVEAEENVRCRKFKFIFFKSFFLAAFVPLFSTKKYVRI
jgi:hypothetical protein